MIKSEQTTCPPQVTRLVPVRCTLLRSQGGSLRAFTLVELLVVIAILAILAAILLPALNRSVEQGRNVACINNLRQLQLCWHMYSDDHEGELPPNPPPGPGVGGGGGGASGGLSPIGTGSSWCLDMPRSDTTPTMLQRGVLFPYGPSVPLYHCPSDQSTTVDSQGNKTSQPRFRSYSMSASVDGSATNNVALGDNSLSFARYSEIVNPNPAQLFVFIDENPDNEYDARHANFGLYPANAPFGSSYWYSLPSDRHNQGANLSFADGHVEHWRWAYPKLFNNSIPQPAVNPQDLKDLRRLQGAMKQID